MFKKCNFFIILIFFLAVAIGCSKESRVPAAKEAEVLADDIVEVRDDQAKLANIKTGQIEIRTLSNALQVSGKITVSPQSLATVCAPMGGFIKSIAQMPGSRVSKGQILAVIENPEFVDIQQNYVEAKSRFEFAEAQYNRHSELFKSEVYSKENMQQVTADYKTLKAQVRSLEQKLVLIGIDPAAVNEDNISGSTTLVSPINGYLNDVHVNIGKYVTSTDAVFEIVNNDDLLLEITLFEKDADKINPGQKISFYVNNETEKHEAVVKQTGKSIDEDRTGKVFARVSGKCKNLLPGMFVNAFIESENSGVTALPSEAIVNFDDKDYIFVFEKNKEEAGRSFTEYRMVEVHKGITGEGYTQVILPEGFKTDVVQVVVKGAYNLLSAKKNAGEMAC